MTFQPVVPISGYAGWAFLERTREVQQTAFDNSSLITRQVAYFTENIGAVTSAEDLVNDRRLLEVALGAFGLSEDINNKYFLQKILEDGTLNPEALGNRLADKRYFEFAKAFGFGDFSTPRTVLSEFPEEITSAFKTNQFEVAIGNQNPNMRLALGLESALAAINDTQTTDDGRWFAIMGQPPVREVFEKALGLPSSIGALDLDQQLKTFRERSESIFGESEVSGFAEPDKQEDLLRLFLLRADNSSNAFTSGSSAALTILQNANGAGGLFGLLG